MTSEDDTGGRLTELHGSGRRLYWDCTVRLYEDVLHARPLRVRDEREIRRRLSTAHLRRARMAFAERRAGSLIRELVAGARTSPWAMIRSVGDGMRRRALQGPDRFRRA